MPILLVLLFIVVPIVELYVIVQAGQQFGIVPTLVVLVADSLLGSLLLRSQGRAVWRRFNAELSRGRLPHTEILDGVLVIFGGALLLTPGFLTDLVGLALLFPPTRALARRALVRVLGRRLVVGVAAGGTRRPRPEAAPGRAYDVEGTATEPPPDDHPGRARLPR